MTESEKSQAAYKFFESWKDKSANVLIEQKSIDIDLEKTYRQSNGEMITTYDYNLQCSAINKADYDQKIFYKWSIDMDIFKKMLSDIAAMISMMFASVKSGQNDEQKQIIT